MTATIDHRCECGVRVTLDLTRGPETIDEYGAPEVTVYIDGSELDHHHEISEAHDEQ